MIKGLKKFPKNRRLCPDGVDLVLDCLSGDHTNKGISVTKPLGKYIIYGTAKNLDGESKNYFAIAKNYLAVDKISPTKLYEENRSISGFSLHNLLFNPVHGTRRFIVDILNKLFNMYRDGLIKPIIDSVYSFDDVIISYTTLDWTIKVSFP
jgi:NADPH:quinone reductase-like Zn-dependent oxidoreductase